MNVTRAVANRTAIKFAGELREIRSTSIHRPDDDVFGNTAIAKLHDSISPFGYGCVMGDHDESLVELIREAP